MLKKRKTLLKIKKVDKKSNYNGNHENNTLSNNSSLSENSSNKENKLIKKRKFNSFVSDFDNRENDEQILKKIRQGDKSIFLIQKEIIKSEIKSEPSLKDNFAKDTIVRLRNRMILKMLTSKINFIIKSDKF